MDAVNKTNGTIASERTVWVSSKLLTKTLRPKNENASNPHFCNIYERNDFSIFVSRKLSAATCLQKFFLIIYQQLKLNQPWFNFVY